MRMLQFLPNTSFTSEPATKRANSGRVLPDQPRNIHRLHLVRCVFGGNVARLHPGDQLEAAIGIFGNRRAAFHPVAGVDVADVTDLLDDSMVDMTTDHALRIVTARWIFNGKAGAIAGRLRRPGAAGWTKLLGYNLAKGGYGALACLGNALILSPSRSLRGLRVAMSATGGVLGLFSPLPRDYEGARGAAEEAKRAPAVE